MIFWILRFSEFVIFSNFVICWILKFFRICDFSEFCDCFEFCDFFRILWFFCSVKVKVIPTYLYEKSVFGYFRSIFSSGKLVTRWFVDRRECCCQRPRSRFIRELINSDKSENESGKYTQHTVSKHIFWFKNSSSTKSTNLNFDTEIPSNCRILDPQMKEKFEFSCQKSNICA